MESFTTRDVARLLGLTETQVRSQARAGFLTPERGPRNRYRFSFQDLVLLRTARELAHARVPPRRIWRALRDLARHLPGGRSLSEIRITANGHNILVHEGGAAWNPESGQLQIEFAGPELAGRRAAVTRALVPDALETAPPRSAWEWFDLGVELETADPAQAYHAYGQALSIDPTLSDAHVNLGRLLQLAGRTREAIEHYRLSQRPESTDPTGAFNLGTALEELGRWRAALSAYLRAVDIDPRFADAHFNLARLYEQLGRRAEAIRHLRAYKRLVE
ncbi:MAG TPA: tetratricopeptide repeat protein, partial [Gemmatimonadales bacterium]|jgi:tetratricopeptide (TPR) repeat protein|nr:tetratricopeptide repeat protein [Gemmatimonadales bacterium]